MKDDKNKAKLVTLGIAVLLIVIVCGISLVIHMINKKESGDSNGKLQSDIIEYANSTQGQTVTAEDITEKKEQAEKEQAEKEQAEKEQAEKEQAEKEQQKKEEEEKKKEEEEVKKEDSESATVADKEKTEEKEKETVYEQKLTAKWQKDANEDLSTVKVDLSRQMSEMRKYWEEGNMKAVEDLAYLPDTGQLLNSLPVLPNIFIMEIPIPISVRMVQDLPCTLTTSIIMASGKTA